MRRLVGAATVASAVALWTLHGAPVVAQAPTVPANPQIDIDYAEPATAAFAPIRQRLKDRKVLETLRQFLAPLKLTDKLLVKFAECGDMVVRYKRGGPATICYEYVADIERLAPKSTVVIEPGPVEHESAIVGPVVQAVLHEVAIAVFDMLDIPVWGRVDDAADRVAAFIMLQFGEDVAWNTVVGFAWYLSGNALAAPDFSDLRGVIAQRYYTTLCIGYAGDIRLNFKSTERRRLSWFEGTAGGSLPSARAASCLEEFDTLREAFNDTIMVPHVDKPLIEQVRKAIKWQNLAAGK